MAGFEQTYEGLEDLVLRDQFFITCDKPLQTFLKEKGKMSLNLPGGNPERYSECILHSQSSNPESSSV